MEGPRGEKIGVGDNRWTRTCSRRRCGIQRRGRRQAHMHELQDSGAFGYTGHTAGVCGLPSSE
jgi:hypothetical protein